MLRLLTALSAFALLGQAQPRRIEPKEFNRFLFFAVLEGLMEDGVPDETVASILEQDEKHQYVNFVYSCPICMPVINACQAFVQREKFFYYGWKGDPYLGEGRLPQETRTLLASADRGDRREGLSSLVKRFVERRMSLLKLEGAEKAAWMHAFEAGLKQGMESQPAMNPGLGNCPSCLGANSRRYERKK